MKSIHVNKSNEINEAHTHDIKCIYCLANKTTKNDEKK